MSRAGFVAHVELWSEIPGPRQAACIAALRTGTDCRPGSLQGLVSDEHLAVITAMFQSWRKEVRPPFVLKTRAPKIGARRAGEGVGYGPSGPMPEEKRAKLRAARAGRKGQRPVATGVYTCGAGGQFFKAIIGGKEIGRYATVEEAVRAREGVQRKAA